MIRAHRAKLSRLAVTPTVAFVARGDIKERLGIPVRSTEDHGKQGNGKSNVRNRGCWAHEANLAGGL